jgi:hypothetical protein
MGRFWLHNVPDHWIHYSRRGVEDVFGRAGFRVTRRFLPVKCVIPVMAFIHAGLVLARAKRRPPSTAAEPDAGLVLARAKRPRARRLPEWRLWLNMGEMGLLLERHADRREATP